MWKPKDPKAIALIKLTVWTGLLTWMAFTLAYGVTAAYRASLASPELFGTGTWGAIMSWTFPVFIIFTSLMLVWAVGVYAYKKLRRSRSN